MDRLIQMGKDLGYAGEKLQDFVTCKQQQDYERGERIAERELERDRIAAEKDKLAAQEIDTEIELARIAAEEAKADKERELERDKLAAQEKDRQIELAKITAERDIEMKRIEGIAEQAERDRELKRTELETNRESKLSSQIEFSLPGDYRVTDEALLAETT